MAKPEIQYIRYYTAGTAAQRLDPVLREETKPAVRPRKKRQPVLYIDPVAILGMVTAVILVICMFVGLSVYEQAQQEYAQMDAYARRLERENEELTRTYAEGYDLEEVRLDAVLMGYVPEAQVEHVTLHTPAPAAEEEEPGFMDGVWLFLTELFA